MPSVRQRRAVAKSALDRVADAMKQDLESGDRFRGILRFAFVLGSKLGREVAGKLVHDHLGGILDQRSSAPILSDRTGQLDIGVHKHAGAFWSTRKSERDVGLRGSSRLGFGTARFRHDAMVGLVDFLVNQLALEVEEHGAKANRNRADIGSVLALL